jgi:hypothetical protein
VHLLGLLPSQRVGQPPKRLRSSRSTNAARIKR